MHHLQHPPASHCAVQSLRFTELAHRFPGDADQLHRIALLCQRLSLRGVS